MNAISLIDVVSEYNEYSVTFVPLEYKTSSFDVVYKTLSLETNAVFAQNIDT